jgi:multiple sugar transport system substrate-binding protein
MAQGMLEVFRRSHPDIQAFYALDPENFEEKMLADLQGGTAADVFQGCCGFLPSWAQSGHLLDLRPFVKADLPEETIADWDPVQYNSYFSGDGKQYALPKYHGALALYYNKDLFDAHGVDYADSSWDHDDYLDAMRMLVDEVGDDRHAKHWGSMFDVSWDRIQVHVNGFGGRYVDPANPRKSWMAEPPALAAVEWLRARIWDDRVMATRLDVNNMSTRQAFIAQRVAMVEDGSWALKDILDGAAFRVGVAPLPMGPARRATLATTDGFGIYARTRHPKESWELLKFLIGKEYGRAMAQAHLLQPARASLVADWAGYVRTQYPKQAAELDIAAFADGHLKGYSVITEVFSDMASAQRIATDAWESILTLGQAPTTAMRSASREIDQAQSRN